jgi:murein DD-endopeptidase MepM/ murein hydrolase activator NlpD
MRVHGACLLVLLLAGCAPDSDVPKTSAVGRGDYDYAWPVAPECKQRLERNPDFGHNLRLRKDGSRRRHLGVDLIPPSIDLRVYAARDGVIVENTAARGSGWGHYLVIRHADGLRTLYGHLEAPSKLPVGTKVAQGTVLGIAGQTETWYVHVHFEVLSKGDFCPCS